MELEICEEEKNPFVTDLVQDSRETRRGLPRLKAVVITDELGL